MKRSARETSALGGKEKTLPYCSATNRRSEPGANAQSTGFRNCSFGNTRTTLNGGGGSGEPTIRDEFQGLRLATEPSVAGSDESAMTMINHDVRIVRQVTRRLRRGW